METSTLVLVAGGDPAARRVAGELVARVNGAARVRVLSHGDPAVPGAGHVPGRLGGVEAEAGVALAEDGRRMRFDRLVVAVGARQTPRLPGALAASGPEDLAAVEDVLRRARHAARAGVRTHLAVIADGEAADRERGHGVALRAARHAAALGAREAVEIALITEEPSPPADLLAALQAEGVRVHAGARARDWAFGWVHLEPDGHVPADRIIAPPAQAGPALAGLPSDARGYVLAEPDGRVPGAQGVWALGHAVAPPGPRDGRGAAAIAAAVSEEILPAALPA